MLPGQDSVLRMLLILTPFGSNDFADAPTRAKLQSAISIKLQIPFSNVTISDVHDIRRNIPLHDGLDDRRQRATRAARSPSNLRVEITVQARVGPAGGDSAQVALVQLGRISEGELDGKIAAVFGKQNVRPWHGSLLLVYTLLKHLRGMHAL